MCSGLAAHDPASDPEPVRPTTGRDFTPRVAVTLLPEHLVVH
jgi:hypothetical protein